MIQSFGKIFEFFVFCFCFCNKKYSTFLTHGATVGELDRDQLFYAAARGLDPAGARALLLEGFVGGLWDGIDGDDLGIADLARSALKAIA